MLVTNLLLLTHGVVFGDGTIVAGGVISLLGGVGGLRSNCNFGNDVNSRGFYVGMPSTWQMTLVYLNV